MLLFLPVNGIRVTVFLEAALNLVLFKMLLGLDREWLAEARGFRSVAAFKTFLAKNVTEFIGVSFRVGTIVGIDPHLIIIVIGALVALIQLFRDVELLARRWNRCDWFVEEDAGCQNYDFGQELIEVDCFIL